MSPIVELSPAELRRVCDVSRFTFESTSELPLTKKIIGQPRGTRAIEFGIEITSPGFNIYVLGPTGTGRTTTIERFVQEKAATGDVPQDWVYVQNFKDPRRPRAIALPPGLGAQFRDDLEELVTCLQREIPKAFEAEEYSEAHSKITQELEVQRDRILQAIQHQAAEQGFTIIRTPDGLMVAPVVDGQPMPIEAYQALPPDRQETLDETRRQLEKNLDDILQDVLELEQAARDEIVALDQRVAASVVDHYVESLRGSYAAEEEALLQLGLMREEIIEHADHFRPADKLPDEDGRQAQGNPFGRYLVNLIVDNSQLAGAPVIVESNPSYRNLVGQIEYDIQFGAPTTNFTNTKAGSLHKANGGYLVLRAGDLLDQPHAWQALKRALNDQVICIEPPAAENIATKTLDPEPIPLDIKIVLMGSPSLYYSLFARDEDFGKLFKVKADFDALMDRSPENEKEFALFVASRCHEENLRHFGKEAVGKIVEYGSYLAGSQDKLITRFGKVADLVREASFWAGKAGREIVQAEDVTQAIRERTFRSNLLEERLRKKIREGTLFIDTEGAKVGQVNGLYVLQTGDHSFGQPARITAQTYMGRAGVVSIEREVELAGPIHNRGVMTLSGFLGGTYAHAHPLSLSASIPVEQNYAGVEGDSASSAELYALLSSLSETPIKQSIAVTGSVNQWGQVQPIGGVTEKIEGFFAVCQERGLTGDQGVLIPAANQQDLMLCEKVVDAVAQGQFHVWTAETIDQGLETLTGTPAGKREADGNYPPGSIHQAVKERLYQLAVELESFSSDKKE